MSINIGDARVDVTVNWPITGSGGGTFDHVNKLYRFIKTWILLDHLINIVFSRGFISIGSTEVRVSKDVKIQTFIT